MTSSPQPRTQRASQRLAALFVLLGVVGFLPLNSSVQGAQNPEPVRLESFTLADQFGTHHAVTFPRERPLLLVVGDRRGSEEIDAWIPPLKERWKDLTDMHGIADVQAVPRFLRGRITEAIRKSRPKPLLLDFEGRVTSALPCEKKAANIFAISKEGRILAHVFGPFVPGTNAQQKLDRIAQALASP